MSNALMVYNDFDTMQRTALALHESGYFSDSKNKAQAIVKVMAGAELGIPPFASMTGIHIIQGKPALGANVIATLIKNDPRYNYKVLELTDTVCRIQFYENGEPVGLSEFTDKDATRANVKNMQKFPKNMLFARAISNGAKWYTPGIFGGNPVYTPDELGADVDEDGNVIEGEIVVSTSRNEVSQNNDNGHKPPPSPEPEPPPFDVNKWYSHVIGHAANNHYRDKHHIDGTLKKLKYIVPETREQAQSLVEPLLKYARYRELNHDGDAAIDMIVNGQEPLGDE